MPETNKKTESPQTPDNRSIDTTGLAADVRATRDEALRDARSTVTRAGRVMDIVEQGELTESRRTALEVLKEKLTMLQTRIDKTEGVASEIERTLTRIDAKVKEEDRLREEIALTEARTYVTNPAQWSEFIGYAGGILRRQEYVSKDAVAHPDDATLKALNTRRDAAVRAYSANTPATPTTHNWQPNTENERRVLGAMKALAELEDVTQQYEKYRGMVDGIRTLGDRALLVPNDTSVTLDVRRGSSQQPNLITLDSAPNTTYTSGTQDLTIQRTPEGWNVTMKPEFTGTVLVNRTPNAANWNRFTFGTPERNPAPERTAPPTTPERTAPRTGPTQQRQTPRTENPNSPARTPERAESSTLRSRGFGGPEPSATPPLRTPTQRPATQPTQPRAAAPSQPSQERAPTQRSAAPSTQPRTPTPAPNTRTRENTESMRNSEVVQTSATTLEFPANNPVNISYKTSRAYNAKPYELRTNVSKLDFYLYSITKENGVWKFSMKPGQSGEITIGLADGKTQSFQLGEGAPFTPPSATKKAPAAGPTTPNAPEKKTPQKTPAPESKIATTRSISGTPEKIDASYARFDAIYKDYTSTIVKDYEKYGGTTEWKFFNQAFEQLMAEMEMSLGDSPRFTDLKKWKASVKTKERQEVERVSAKMEKLLATYKATKLEAKAPSAMQRIDTTKGNLEDAKKNIEKFRKAIAAKGGPRAKEFASLDALYTESYTLAKTSAAKKAIIVCHEQLAQNYATAKEAEKDGVFGSMFSLVSDAASFRPGMDPDDLRMQLIERAERTPFNLKLTPKELVQLMAWKHKVDALRADTTLTEQQRHDQIGKYFADHYSIFESIRSNTSSQMKQLKAIGYNVDVAMNDVINPETIDWLVATHVSATPVKGMSDQTFFDIYPIKTTEKVAPKKATTPEIPKTTEIGSEKKGELRAKGIPRSISTISDPTLEKDDTAKYGGRLLTPKEVQDLGLVILKGEKAKVLDGDTYIACTKHNCRPIKSKAQMEEADKEKKEAAKTTKNTPPVQPAESATKMPEINNGISANGREFRIGINESFTMNFNPPMGGSSSVSFTPSSYDLKGIVVNAKKYSDVWVIDVVPQYEGTITLTRARDKASASLTVKADPVALAAIEKAKDLTVREISTEEEFNELVLKSPVPVVVDLYATWCGPCKQMQPDLEAIARDQGGTVRVVKVDGEKFSRIQSEYAPKENGQYKFPTLLIFERGKKLRGAIGRLPRDKIQELLPPLERSNVTMR